jgi:hypothetical protein
MSLPMILDPARDGNLICWLCRWSRLTAAWLETVSATRKVIGFSLGSATWLIHGPLLLDESELPWAH